MFRPTLLFFLPLVVGFLLFFVASHNPQILLRINVGFIFNGLLIANAVGWIGWFLRERLQFQSEQRLIQDLFAKGFAPMPKQREALMSAMAHLPCFLTRGWMERGEIRYVYAKQHSTGTMYAIGYAVVKRSVTIRQTMMAMHRDKWALPLFEARPKGMLNCFRTEGTIPHVPEFSRKYRAICGDNAALRSTVNLDVCHFLATTRTHWIIEGGIDWLLVYQKGVPISAQGRSRFLADAERLCTLFAR